jgi:CubicO group peptidase (beta-lactamase class C family)
MPKPAQVSLALIITLAGGIAAAAGIPPLNRQDVESYTDSQIQPALARSGVPGAVVVIVRHDATLLAKGYGVSDLEKHTLVDGDRTLFDVASIGKAMTAIVTLQLIDEGRLNLNSDVNHYLKSAAISGQPITLRMLLGHRGGFDADLTGLFVPFDRDTRVSVRELRRRLRPIAPPGRVTAYDNQGYGVIGLVLRDLTQEPLPELLRQRLFEPLAMTGAVLGRPPDSAARLARCYVVHGPGAADLCPYWLYRDAIQGAGGVAASGADMARFMRMLLSGGVLDGHRVLSERAFSDLLNFGNYRFNPGMPGMGRAFTQLEENRGLEYAHGGGMPGFTSLMTLYPDADIGVFVSFLGGQLPSFDARLTNMLQDIGAVEVSPAARPALLDLQLFTQHFADRFIPADRPRSSTGSIPAAPGAEALPGDLSGEYYPAQEETHSLGLRMVRWFSGVHVTQARDGELTVAGAGLYRRIAPELFENAKGKRIAFARLGGDDFMAVHLSAAVYRKKSWLQAPVWSVLLTPLLLIALLSALPHLRRRAAPGLRRLALGSAVGTALILVGLCCELQFARDVRTTGEHIAALLLWRAVTWGGAGLLLWSAWQFFRRSADLIWRWPFLHGLLIAAAAIVLPLIVALWTVPLWLLDLR